MSCSYLFASGVVQGMITGIRGLCNGLGPALYGFVFYLFHVELTDTDGSEKGAKSNMVNPTDEVSMNDNLNIRYTIKILSSIYRGCSLNSSFFCRLFRVPSSQVLHSYLVLAQCCCLCWWPFLSQSTQGLAWDPAPIRSTATGHRVTPTALKAVGPRARSHCWRTAVYNLSQGGQTPSLQPNTPLADTDRYSHFTTWTHSHLRHTSDSSAMKMCLYPQHKSGHFLSSSPFLFFKQGSVRTLWKPCVKRVRWAFSGCSGKVCVIWLSWTLFLGFHEAVTEWSLQQLAPLLLVQHKTEVMWFRVWVAFISNVAKSLCGSSCPSVACEVATLSVCPTRVHQTGSWALVLWCVTSQNLFGRLLLQPQLW